MRLSEKSKCNSVKKQNANEKRCLIIEKNKKILYNKQAKRENHFFKVLAKCERNEI